MSIAVVTALRGVVAIARKELSDAARDRRTWLTALLSAIVIGPGVMLALAGFLSGLDERAARREVVVAGVANGPTLANYLERRGARIVAAPADYERRIAAGELRNAVIVIGEDFERHLASGEPAPIQLVFDGANGQARGAVDYAARLLDGFGHELTAQRTLARGVALPLIGVIDVERRDLATPRARGVQLLAMIPWVVLMIAAVGAAPIAIDVGAGERERGSLEPLLGNPVDRAAIVLGKWIAVAAASIAVVAVTLAAYVVTFWAVDNETLAAQLQFGPAEALGFAVLLAPFAGLAAAVLMLVATCARSFREAQAYVSQVVLAVNLVPLAKLLLDLREAPWQLPLPVIGQLIGMTRVLRGEPLAAADIVLPAVGCAAGVVACLLALRRLLSSEHIVFGR